MLTKQEARERIMNIVIDKINWSTSADGDDVYKIVNAILSDPELAKGWGSE